MPKYGSANINFPGSRQSWHSYAGSAFNSQVALKETSRSSL
jgi:hypothetical protein